MIRILLIAFVVFVAIVLFRRILVNLFHAANPPKKLSSAMMVKCSYCQLHIPESESLASGDKYFCCDEHQKLMEEDTE